MTVTSSYTKKPLISHFRKLPCGHLPGNQEYRSGTVNSNTVNSKFHLIRSFCEMFSYHFPNISCLKCTVNSNFHLIRSKTLPTNDFELTVPDLYCSISVFQKIANCELSIVSLRYYDFMRAYSHWACTLNTAAQIHRLNACQCRCLINTEWQDIKISLTQWQTDGQCE